MTQFRQLRRRTYSVGDGSRHAWAVFSVTSQSFTGAVFAESLPNARGIAESFLVGKPAGEFEIRRCHKVGGQPVTCDCEDKA